MVGHSEVGNLAFSMKIFGLAKALGDEARYTAGNI
jgi:hypothetical protein